MIRFIMTYMLCFVNRIHICSNKSFLEEEQREKYLFADIKQANILGLKLNIFSNKKFDKIKLIEITFN